MRLLVPALWLVCACEARLGVPNGVDVDAPGNPDGTQLGIDAADAAPACANGRVVFLNFEGQALTDATTSDAAQNKASWMQIASGTAPPYHQGSATRVAEIQAVVDGVRAQLSSFPVTVVTTRPAAGEYVMIVYGGVASQVGSRFGAAVQELDCADAVRNDVAWVADAVTPTQRVVNFSVGAIGFGLGLTATTDPNDCMCGWDNICTSNNAVACTLTPGIARDPAANQQCAGTTQDETAVFNAAFCQ